MAIHVFFGLVGGVVCYFLNKPVLMVSTALGGAFVAVMSFGIVIDIPKVKPGLDGKATEVPWQYYVWGGLWLVLSTAGLVVQIIYRSKDEEEDDDLTDSMIDDKYSADKSGKDAVNRW